MATHVEAGDDTPMETYNDDDDDDDEEGTTEDKRGGGLQITTIRTLVRKILCQICWEEVPSIGGLRIHLNREHNILVDGPPEVIDQKDFVKDFDEKNELDKVSDLLDYLDGKPRTTDPPPPVKTEDTEDKVGSGGEEAVDGSQNCFSLTHGGVKSGRNYCSLCCIELPDYMVKDHMRYHSEGLFFDCPHCTKPFTLQHDLKHHLKDTTTADNEEKDGDNNKQNELKHWCPEILCSVGFASKKCLFFHRTKCHDGLHRCPDCEKTFRTYALLRKHVQRSHNQVNKLLPCTVPGCNKAFKCNRGRTTHWRQMHNNIPSGPSQESKQKAKSRSRLNINPSLSTVPSNSTTDDKLGHEDAIMKTAGTDVGNLFTKITKQRKRKKKKLYFSNKPPLKKTNSPSVVASASPTKGVKVEDKQEVRESPSVSVAATARDGSLTINPSLSTVPSNSATDVKLGHQDGSMKTGGTDVGNLFTKVTNQRKRKKRKLYFSNKSPLKKTNSPSVVASASPSPTKVVKVEDKQDRESPSVAASASPTKGVKVEDKQEVRESPSVSVAATARDGSLTINPSLSTVPSNSTTDDKLDHQDGIMKTDVTDDMENLFIKITGQRKGKKRKLYFSNKPPLKKTDYLSVVASASPTKGVKVEDKHDKESPSVAAAARDGSLTTIPLPCIIKIHLHKCDDLVKELTRKNVKSYSVPPLNSNRAPSSRHRVPPPRPPPARTTDLPSSQRNSASAENLSLSPTQLQPSSKPVIPTSPVVAPVRRCPVPICNKLYSSDRLPQHLKFDHPEFHFCPICSRPIKNKERVFLHMKELHPYQFELFTRLANG